MKTENKSSSRGTASQNLAEVAEDTSKDLMAKIRREELTIIEKTTQSDANYGFIYFDLGNTQEDSGEEVHLIGKIPMMHPPEKYAHPIAEEVKFCTNWMEQFMLTHKLVRKTDMVKRRKIRELARDLFTLYMLFPHDIDMTSELSCLVVALSQFIFETDDLLEETSLLARNQEHSLGVYQYFTEILNADLNLKSTSDSMLPEIFPEAKAVLYIMKELEPVLPDWKTEGQPLTAAVKSSFVGLLCLQLADQHKKFNEKTIGRRNLSEDTFKFLRRSDAAGRASIEIGLLVLGIEIPQEMRENLFFQRFMEVVELIIACQNDLVSLRKDIERKEWNIVLFKAQKSGLSLEDAFNEVVKLIEELIDDYNYLKTLISNLFEKYEDVLGEFFEGVGAVIDLNGYLLMYTTRYGDLKKAFLNVELPLQDLQEK